MKTVLFFYLNSVGLVLVVTQTAPLYRGPLLTDCRLANPGHEYAGTLNKTQYGRTCQRWNSDQPHRHRFKNSILFPEGSAEAAGNKCRNPDTYEIGGVWCYTTDPKIRWEYCNVDFCDCKLTKTGQEYAGPQNKTKSGLTCQRWNSDQPHPHIFKNWTLFPEGSAEAAGNKCRNPDGNSTEGVWCYTTDPNIESEQCDVDFCKLTGAMTGTSSSEWQTILLFIFAGLLLVATGIILYLCRKRCSAPYKGETIDVPLEDVSRQRPMVRGASTGLSPTDLPSEEARIPAGKDHPTEQAEEVNPYMGLAPDFVAPPVYAALRVGDYLVLKN